MTGVQTCALPIFYNAMLGTAMWVSRFWIIVPVLALAGSLARKKLVPAGAGTLPTHTPLFIAFLVLCAVPILAEAVIIYLHHNLSLLARIELPLDRLIAIDARFFGEFVVNLQCAFAFFLALFVGPGLVSPDLRNNALPQICGDLAVDI